MDISRRRLLLAGAAGPFAAFPTWVVGALPSSKTLFVILDAVGDTLSATLAAQVFEVFFSMGIPVSATLRCAGAAPENSDFGEVLKKTLAQEPGLFEVALDIATEPEFERYFGLRDAIDMRDCLLDGADYGASPPIISVLDRGGESKLNPYALRAAGFRVQLQPKLGESRQILGSASDFEVIDWGIARLSGGALALIEAVPAEGLEQTGAAEGAQVLYLSFENAGRMAPDDLLVSCQLWAARLQAAMLSENTFLTRPMDYLLQGHPGASKYVGLVLDQAFTPDGTENMAAFAARLAGAKIPYTVLQAEQGLALSDMVDSCVVQAGHSANTSCVFQQEAAPLPAEAPAEIVLKPARSRYFWNGPRSDGRFHAAVEMEGVTRFASLLEADPLTDVVFRVGPAHVATPIQQEALMAAFVRARQDGKAHFYSVRGYVEQTAAPDAVLNRFWATKRRHLSDPAVPAPLGDTEQEALMADARLAWQFIDKFSDDKTGICAGTVQAGSKNIVNHAVTLWDVASQLNGIHAAQRLALIPAGEAAERVARILAHLPAASMGGVMLPPALFAANSGASLRQGFDACDTGRFLIALNKVVDAGLATRQQAQDLRDTWDIGAAVQNQRPFDFENGGWRDVSQSHCTHYARNGYEAWGYPVLSPYPALGAAPTGDQHIRLLYKAAFIGHFGAEPVLLEGLELGYSPESKYLAQVLFAAQLGWFEETGALKCVSETVLNFEPWFAYQGLRVDRSGPDQWAISTISGHSDYQATPFLEKADILSSKAAYLWMTLYPHAYSRRLVALIREKAQIDGLGFSVGIFSQTQKAMEGYSDVNTNGIILAAIARQLDAG